ncbi:hypothetical protein BKI52_20885 [marine bacterium AO1-C]|nr:hypothetical protein BKI52_20885 [marine bacterium AO1-C]
MLSALMTLNGLFLSGVLWQLKNGKKQANRVLALLFLGIALRMGKTLVFYLGGRSVMFYFNITIGFFLAIGPLLWLYTCFFLHKEFKFQQKHWIHFVPGLIFCVFSPFIVPNHELLWWNLTYIAVLGQMLGYLVWIGVRLFLQVSSLTTLIRKWLWGLWAAVFIIWLTFVAHFLIDFPVPFIGIMLYLMVMYAMVYLGLTHSKLFIADKGKYYSSSLSQTNAQQYAQELQQMMSNEKPYLNPDLTLAKLAQSLNITTHTLSQVINEQFHQTYAEFVAHYRIEAAKQALVAPDNPPKKIASIAFEVGFNTLSAFNTLFKKQTGMTPSSFRKENS